MKDRFIAAAVIDGVGGYEGGEVAADLARGSILNYFSVPSGSVPTMMQEALAAANEKIVREKQANNAYQKMACVVTLALIEKGSNKFYYAHVGDTRLYLFRDGSLVKVTKDQSFVGFLEDSGRLDEAAAMTHPKRNEINKALGFEAPIQNQSEYIETGESPFLPGDLLLLCSDGLTDMIDRGIITDILSQKGELSGKAQSLIQAANDAGGKDNITVVLVQNDYAPAKQKATKPLKKNEISAEQPQQESATLSAAKAKSGSSGRLVILLSVLVILLSVAFIWQFLKNHQGQRPNNEPGNSVVYTGGSLHLQDTFDHVAGNRLDLSESNLGDVIFLPDTLWIRHDSMTIYGAGNTILTADSAARQNAVVMVSPGIHHLVFDSLTIQDINIQVPGTVSPVVHFNHVRFQNASFSRLYTLSDTLITGVMGAGSLKDSVQKGAILK